ncbi:MAG: PEP/pyruvate-binding domain-containing protein [Thermodesulfovibrionales bacterium]
MKALVRRWLSALGLPGRRTMQPLSFEQLFQHFREVLDSKNRALEIIAEMGETLGGDYLFDITYIRKAYADLDRSVKKALELFDKLTQGRYAVLGEIGERIDRQVRLIIDEPGPAEGEMIIFHRDITGDISRAVGGKNANLAELRNFAEVNIPEGFAVTAYAFDEFIRYNDLGGLIQSLATGTVPGQAVKDLREAVVRAEIPPSLVAAFESALERIRGKNGNKVFLAVRSSAAEEDGDFSFAGQFESVLNVLPVLAPVLEAYKQVIASLFSLRAFEYHRQAGIDLRGAKMAVCCLVMVDAAVSGVAYSTDPSGPDAVIVNAAWGLGAPIVEGQVETDQYVVDKGPVPRIIGKKTGNKPYRVVGSGSGGVMTEEVPPAMTRTLSLSDEQVMTLALQTMHIEKHFRRPYDIEWAVDKLNNLFILQARPLRVQQRRESAGAGAGGSRKEASVPTSFLPLLKDKGVIVQKGAAAGRVFVLRHMEELARFPKGGILLARNDSSEFIRALPYAAAIITDVGSPTSHMSSLCREFRVPALVNTRDASKILKHDSEVTVSFDNDGQAIVYEGIVREVLGRDSIDRQNMDDVFEFRKKRYLLRFITPLNLIDPFMDNFAPEGCRTLHDILRFIHEKSVAELVDKARYGTTMLRKQAAVKLELPVPAGLIIIDIGGGLSDGCCKTGTASAEQITSVPLEAIVRGMSYPGIWRSGAVALHATDFLSSMMRMPDMTAGSHDDVGYNIAVASREYVNLSLRFGYHFSMVDCYCSDETKNNHIYFRFSGGATDIAKRSRRIQLIADILKEYGFNITARGDLLIGRLANLPREEMTHILDRLGRLISYTRQLDALLHSESDIERFVQKFLAEEYAI